MPPLLPEGSTLRGRYRITKVLDTSRVRNIYVAEDRHLKGNIWVVKQMQPIGVELDRSSLAAAFEEEARLIAGLDHPNIPRLADFFVQDNLLYIVREYVPGRDLIAIQKDRGGATFSEEDSLKIGIQLSSLMNYVSKNKLSPVIFRELSLQNLVLSKDGQVKLVDFGFSHLFSRESRIGPPDYSAPEQFSEEGVVDSRTLVYNVGALVYHLLTGYNPGSSPFNLPPLHQLRSDLSSETCKVIMKAIQNDRRKRQRDPVELGKGLERALLALRKPRSHKLPRKTYHPTGTQPVPPQMQGLSPTGTRLVNLSSQDTTSSPATIWLIGTVLILFLGGFLIALYYYFLRPTDF